MEKDKEMNDTQGPLGSTSQLLRLNVKEKEVTVYQFYRIR